MTLPIHQKLWRHMRRLSATALVISGMGLGGCTHYGAYPMGTTPPVGKQVDVVLMETTDLHSNILSYDYYKTAEDKTIGLERTATLIEQAREKKTPTPCYWITATPSRELC